jgi:hypothetical protein
MGEPCQPQITRPAAKLIDVNNLEQAALTFQRVAVAAKKTHVEASSSHATVSHVTPVLPGSQPLTQSLQATPSSSLVSTRQPSPSDESYDSFPTGSKRTLVFSSDDEAPSRQKKAMRTSTSTRPNGKY